MKMNYSMKDVVNSEKTFTTAGVRGQKIITPVGKDTSGYSGGASKEISGKMKMGGSQSNLTHSIPASKSTQYN